MLSPKAEEKRASPRYPLERLAKIQPGPGNPSRYCLITDISDGGVRINTFGFNPPDEFELLLSGDGPARDGTYRSFGALVMTSEPSSFVRLVE